MRALVQPIYLRLNILPAPGPATDGTAPATVSPTRQRGNG
jgi:hypothetical protein